MISHEPYCAPSPPTSPVVRPISHKGLSDFTSFMPDQTSPARG
ncbi:hypothetical protein AWU68_1670 [Corynebacterium simulans]|uniref:Uncharacterized protein n=1 Tax=Corynebacterium simulans TaxID=146827 RepID=A0ABR5V6V8_9CORY|nr:hypothetical protein AWU68_1670 [Corynebacterium simulans]KXU17263.1 hypothetical protein WM41_2181 [Corynebacterium simulans]